MGNLIIKNNNITKTYECKTTHTGRPYLKVGKSSYLDLTTNTTSGLQMKLKINNENYRPKQTYTSTSNRSSQYTSTSGYSGASSRVSTSGYSGVSSKVSTSGYSGRSSRSSQYASTSAYSGRLSKASTSGYSGRSTYKSTTGTASWSGSYSGTKSNSIIWRGPANTQIAYEYTSLGTYTSFITNNTMSGTVTLTQYKTTNSFSSSGYETWTYTARSSAKNISSYVSSRTTIDSYEVMMGYYAGSLACSFWGNGSYTDTVYTKYQSSLTDPYSFATASTSSYRTSSAVGNLKSTTALTRSSTYYTSSYTIGVMSSTTALTKTASRTSAYTTSSTAAGQMSYLTTLTRSSNYNTTYAVVGNMSSTTALTRSSSYNTSATNTSGLSSTTALTKTASRSSQYNITTEI